MTSHLDPSRPWQNRDKTRRLAETVTKHRSRNISELRPKDSISKLAKANLDQEARFVPWADQPQADDSVVIIPSKRTCFHDATDCSKFG
jgi:hypothetical protein